MGNAKTVSVQISKIYLDNANPRHEPIDNEPELIANLLKKERVVALAKNIAQKGLNPLERLAVVKHPKISGSFLVVEGNRRLCALKLMRDPRKAPTPKARQTFSELGQKASIPATLDVVEFEDPADARIWMEVRHLGEQSGIGVRKWNVEQKTRFDTAERGNPNALSVQLLDYAETAALITPEERSRISVTTLTRYISNPVFRDAIGLASRRTLEINAPQAEFDLAAKTFLHDAAKLINPPVHSRSNKADVETYVGQLRSAGVARKNLTPVVVVPRAGDSKKRQRNNPSPDLRAKIVPTSFKARIVDNLLKRIFDELREIDPDMAFASTYLLRSFVERLAYRYLVDNGVVVQGKLHVMLAACEKHLSANGSLIKTHGKQKLEKLTKNLRVAASNSDNWLSPETLGHALHGGDVPTATDNKRRWDALEPTFRMLLEGLKT